MFCRDWLAAHGAEGVFIDEALNGVYRSGWRKRIRWWFSRPTRTGVSDEEPLLLAEGGQVIRCPVWGTTPPACSASDGCPVRGGTEDPASGSWNSVCVQLRRGGIGQSEGHQADLQGL